MARLRSFRLVCIGLLLHRALAIQVTPNSPCAAACMDNPHSDPSDPNSSSTHTSDIVCSDSDYTNNAVGQKFKACLTCLQNSTAEASGERDQWWFLYNMRFAFDSCLFGFQNTSTALNTPCSTSASCGYLQQALEDGNLQETGYGYCSANQNSFLGTYHNVCFSCLKISGNLNYLANFLTALQGGCLQQPMSGYFVGLDGSVFESKSVNITYPMNGHPSSGSKSWSQGAIVAVAVSLGVLLLVTILTLYACHRKNRGIRRIKKLQSSFDPRFGAVSITAPTDGAYVNHYSNFAVAQPFDPSKLSSKERHVMGLDRLEAPIPIERPDGLPLSKWDDPGHRKTNHLPAYSLPSIPTHQAYVTNPIPESPTTTIASDMDDPDAIQPIPTSSKNTTPTVSPAHVLERKAAPSPIHLVPLQTSFSRPRILSPQSDPYQPSEGEYGTSNQSESKHVGSKNGIVPTTHEIGGGIELANSSNSTTPAYSPPLLSARSHRSDLSKAESQRSRRSTASRVTRRLGLSNTNASDPNAPLNISRPMVVNGRRFDFISDGQYRQDTTFDRIPHRQLTPEPESPEQWPGNY